MSSVSIRWKLREFLNENRITAYRLMKESGLAQGTIYRLTKSDTTSVNAETLDRLLNTLGRITGKDVGITDVLEYQREAYGKEAG